MTPFGPGYFEDRAEPHKKMFISGEEKEVPLHKRHIFLDNATAAMPNLSEAEGFEFMVQCNGATSDIDISDGISGTQTVTINTSGVQVALKSDGLDWHVSREDA